MITTPHYIKYRIERLRQIIVFRKMVLEDNVEHFTIIESFLDGKEQEYHIGTKFTISHSKNIINENSEPITDLKEIKRLDKKRLLLGVI